MPTSNPRGQPGGRARPAERAGDDRVAFDAGLDEIHPWRAEKRPDERGRRPLVHLARRADLKQPARTHDGDSIGQGHRLDVVVGHVERRGPQAAHELRDLSAQVARKRRVEVGERLVEEKCPRLSHDRSTHGDALPFASRHLARAAFEQSCSIRKSAAASATESARRAPGTRRIFSGNSMIWRAVMCG
jgi:hypothetical protein